MGVNAVWSEYGSKAAQPNIIANPPSPITIGAPKNNDIAINIRPIYKI